MMLLYIASLPPEIAFIIILLISRDLDYITTMPVTRSQLSEGRRLGVYITLDDTAKKITRISGSIHSIANLIGDTIASRPGFRQTFEKSGSRSLAIARSMWRFHDRRWEEQLAGIDGGRQEGEEDEETDEDDRGPIDEEVDERIGIPFTFQRAVEVAISYLDEAKEIVEDRRREMEAWNDHDGAQFIGTIVEQYKTELERWRSIQGRLNLCTTTLGESHLDSSLQHGWI